MLRSVGEYARSAPRRKVASKLRVGRLQRRLRLHFPRPSSQGWKPTLFPQTISRHSLNTAQACGKRTPALELFNMGEVNWNATPSALSTAKPLVGYFIAQAPLEDSLRFRIHSLLVQLYVSIRPTKPSPLYSGAPSYGATSPRQGFFGFQSLHRLRSAPFVPRQSPLHSLHRTPPAPFPTASKPSAIYTSVSCRATHGYFLVGINRSRPCP